MPLTLQESFPLDRGFRCRPTSRQDQVTARTHDGLDNHRRAESHGVWHETRLAGLEPLRTSFLGSV